MQGNVKDWEGQLSTNKATKKFQGDKPARTYLND
jgi:hypothetical protein